MFYPYTSKALILWAMKDGWIHISEVLADMETIMSGGRLHTFSLSWVRVRRGTGGARGSIKKVRVAAKYTKPNRKISGGGQWKFKDHDTIPIQDIEKDQLLTPKYTHIIEYNGLKVQHYGE